MCPPGTTSPVLRRCVSLCGSTKCCPAEPVWHSPAVPVPTVGSGLDIRTAWLGLQERAGERGKGGGGGDLKIVPISFLQLPFRVRKRARGLPAPVHTAPYIMADMRASLRARNRQGHGIYAALPKPTSSSQEPGPWKQPLGWGKRLVWLAGATQPQPQAVGRGQGLWGGLPEMPQ